MASFFGGSSQGLIVISSLDDDALIAGAVDEKKGFHGLEEWWKLSPPLTS